MKIGIIGATGMIGHHTAIAVQEKGHQLTVIHRQNSALNTLSELKFADTIGDLNDADSLVSAFQDLDAVINCAAYYPTKPLPWQIEVETAAAQMQNFLNACAEVKLKKIVYLGGAIALPKHPQGLPGDESLNYSAQPENKNPYLQVKWAMDRLAQEAAEAGLPLVIAIPAMCFGEFDYKPTTGKLIVDLANQKLPAYLSGDRNIIYAGDAGRGILLACEQGRNGERYLFTGTNISMRELVKLIAQLAQVTPPKLAIPLPLAKLISGFQETKYKLWGGELPQLSATAITVLTQGQFLTGDKAQAELGFRPTLSLAQTIERTLNWFRDKKYIQ